MTEKKHGHAYHKYNSMLHSRLSATVNIKHSDNLAVGHFF